MKQAHPQLGSVEGRVIHRRWKDSLFQEFGARFGHSERPFSSDELSSVLSDPLPEETRDLLQRFGFLVITVEKDFQPGEKDRVLWQHMINDSRSLLNLNMVVHADYDHVALYNRGDRQSHTAISGQSGGAEIVRDALGKAMLPPGLRTLSAEIRHELADIIREKNEYGEESPFLKALYRIHDVLSVSIRENPATCWHFIHVLNTLYQERRKIHKHVWKGNQILLISRQAVHFRLVEHRHLLTEKAGTWRAHLSAD